MANNSLLQLAQVITDHHPSPPSAQLSRSESSPHPAALRSESRTGYLPIRKNACVVCGTCFTCSKTYGLTCRCEEMQPRRGRNLPEGSLDSRAKKLHPQDTEDYAFSLEWLSLHAHRMHKDSTGQVVGLRDLPEVSLCKAHSSTLYRARKRHEKSRTYSPPPPSATHRHPHHPHHHHHHIDSREMPDGGIGGLAAKVREIMNNQQYPPTGPPPPPPDLSVQASTSLKRKRPSPPVHSSASTPLYATAPPMLRHSVPSSSYSHQLPPLQQQPSPQQPHSPPQHGRTPSLSALSSSLQEQLRLSPLRVESVSLKAVPSNPADPPQYYLRNLAITDSFTFRDLLKEVDMTGPPPPGKRVIVIDDKTDTLYPLDQAIRSVIKRPSSAHIELSIGLSNKAAIDWSTYA